MASFQDQEKCVSEAFASSGKLGDDENRNLDLVGETVDCVRDNSL